MLTEVVWQEVETASSEAAAALRQVLAVRERMEEVDSHLADYQTATMELELLRDRENLQQEFGVECKWTREMQEREIQETREWRK